MARFDSTTATFDSTLITWDSTDDDAAPGEGGVPPEEDVLSELSAEAAYLRLITSEHDKRPKFLKTVAASVAPFVDIQNVMRGFPAGYDVDTAVGVQLDAVGLWVGVSRYVAQEIAGVYFTWDDASLGWDTGVWVGPFDPTTGVIALDDEIYRVVIYAKIAANHWDGTLSQAAEIFTDLFGVGTSIVISDNQDMTMTVTLYGAQPPPLLKALLLAGALPLKPEAVSVNYVDSTGGGVVFGWDIANTYMSGWDVGAWS